MRNLILELGMLQLCSTLVLASEKATNLNETDQKLTATSLSELAASADLVAVAQVRDTDYSYTRSFPSEGKAFLRILIPYKLNKPKLEMIEVYEKGLHQNECYFKSPTVLEEGRRYLVFLQIDPEDPENYRGLKQGCALEILVTGDSRYALKYPVEGINISDKLNELATKLEFHDNYALVAGEDLDPSDRDDLLTRGLIIPYQGKFKYTHGVDLTTARGLIPAEALKSQSRW